MGHIRGLRDTHGQAIVFIKAEGCCDCGKIFAFVIEYESVILHGNVKFGQIIVAGTSGEDILNAGNGVYFTFDSLVEGAKVGDPSDFSVFLGYDECWRDPVGSTLRG